MTLADDRDIDPPRRSASVQGQIERSRHDGSDVHSSFRIVTAGAPSSISAASLTPNRSAVDSMFVGAVQDVTESRLAEEALNKARSELAHVARVTTLER